MALINKPNTFSAGATVVASEFNSNFDTIYNDYNGNITTANLSDSATIPDTKLAQITSASKVNLSALVATSQAQGDIIYASSVSAMSRLAVGTDNQILSNDGTDPAWETMTWEHLPDGAVVQVVNASSAAFQDITTVAPVDNTIPTTSETDNVAALDTAITPKSATNNLRIDVVINAGVDNDARSNVVVALFQDAGTDAIATAIQTVTKGNAGSSSVIGAISMTFWVSASSTDARTYKIGVGKETGQSDVSLNGVNGAQLMNGKLFSSVTVTEIKAS